MGFLGRFLSSYNESFAAALGLWPLASFVLTLPILAWLYHRDGRIRLLSAAGAYLAVLYLMGLVCFTLYPLPEGDVGPGITYGLAPILNPLHFVDDIREDGIAAVAQLVANAALFVPFGFIARRGMRLGMVPTVALGFLASLAIELAQLTGLFGVYPYAYRTFETTDLCTNTLGALGGWALAQFSLRVLPARSEADDALVTNRPGFVRRMVAFFVDLALATAAALVATSAIVVAFCAVALPLRATGIHMAPLPALTLLAFAETIALLIVELAIPWKRGGQTPGGTFVRMTCETRERTGSRRVAFYAARTFVVLCATGLPGIEPRLGIVPLACMLFCLIKRRMPYDLI